MTPFTFTLEPMGHDGPPTEIRVRRLLKELARRHRLRVKWPEPIPNASDSERPNGSSDTETPIDTENAPESQPCAANPIPMEPRDE